MCFLFVAFRVFFGVVEGVWSWGEMFETRAGVRWLQKLQKNVLESAEKCDDFWDRGMTEMMEMQVKQRCCLNMMWRWFSFHVDG